MPEDAVKHPKHYTKGIEMWDYAHSHNLDFFEGNVIKYVCRYKNKNGIQDLEKIIHYCELEIKKMKDMKRKK